VKENVKETIEIKREGGKGIRIEIIREKYLKLLHYRHNKMMISRREALNAARPQQIQKRGHTHRRRLGK